MILISSVWENQPTFRLIPILNECPYNECIYDPANKMLAILSKEKKETYHFLPKLDDNGDILKVKQGKPRVDGKPYQEQRVMVPTYYEYFITGEEEITEFIKNFAFNEDIFDYNKYLKSQEDGSDQSQVSAN